jgi:hypothetical protein
MRSPLLPALAAAALLAAPAFAQSNSKTEDNPNAQTQSPSATATEGAMTHHRRMARAELKQSLEQAGFKDVRITAESYVVHARDKNGSPVVMMISPDEVAGVVEQNGSGSTMPPRRGGSSHSDQNSGSPGNQ